jgi:transcription initiation factor TFIID subunit 8
MAEDFSRHISRVVASQIAESTGFDACQDSAVEILGDLLLRYLATVCSGSHSYAELAGRSQSNLSDVLLALEDLGVTPEDLNQHMQLQVGTPACGQYPPPTPTPYTPPSLLHPPPPHTHTSLMPPWC